MIIDFVVTWVDGTDNNWVKKSSSFASKKEQLNISRYRDWGFLKYWFRSVEKYSKWVNKIFLVTDKQVPDWLNVKNEKLVVVDHCDFIPNKYLPTFNSSVIESYIHKIESLSEYFVYFNDDTLINKPINETFFFRNKLPCDSAIMETFCPSDIENKFSSVLLNNISCLNKRFDKRKAIKENFWKWINPKYGILGMKNLYLLPLKKFSALHNPHLPQPYLKSTFTEVWDEFYDLLDQMGNNKFRDYSNDISIYLFRYWQLAKGDFTPKSLKNSKMYTIGLDDMTKIKSDIMSNKSDMICLNDCDQIEDFEKTKCEILIAYEKKLPNKSSFEK